MNTIDDENNSKLNIDKIEEAAKKYSYNSSAIKAEYARAGFMAGATSQEAKEYWRRGMYSEEEVLELLYTFNVKEIVGEPFLVKDWFEAHKKK